MAIMACPECDGRVSTQADACPHCGYPIANPPLNLELLEKAPIEKLIYDEDTDASHLPSEDVHRLAREAEGGSVEATVTLARYLRDTGDIEQSLKLFLTAANAGDIAAKHHLWNLGRRIPDLDDETRGTLEQHLREAANAGFARSQFRLYVLEDTQNKEVAYSWLEKAAIQYHREAICFLGSCLFNGLGTPRKFDVAFRLSLVGAKTDHFLAWQTLASCYHLGAGTNKNLELAFDSWCRAIRAGGSAEDRLIDLAESHPEYADRVKSFLQETRRSKQ